MFGRELIEKSPVRGPIYDLEKRIYIFYNRVLNEYRIKQEFDKLDKSGDGYLNKEEVRKMLLDQIDEEIKFKEKMEKEHGFDHKDDIRILKKQKKKIENKVESYLKENDKDEDKKISFQEFLVYRKKLELENIKELEEYYEYDILDLLKQFKDSLNDFLKTVDIDRLTSRLKELSDERNGKLSSLFSNLIALWIKTAQNKTTDDYEVANYYYFCKVFLECRSNQDNIYFSDILIRKFFNYPEENIPEMKEMLIPIVEKMIQELQG